MSFVNVAARYLFCEMCLIMQDGQRERVYKGGKKNTNLALVLPSASRKFRPFDRRDRCGAVSKNARIIRKFYSNVNLGIWAKINVGTRNILICRSNRLCCSSLKVDMAQSVPENSRACVCVW